MSAYKCKVDISGFCKDCSEPIVFITKENLAERVTKKMYSCECHNTNNEMQQIADDLIAKIQAGGGDQEEVKSSINAENEQLILLREIVVQLKALNKACGGTIDPNSPRIMLG